jgi:hypothetical protein
MGNKIVAWGFWWVNLSKGDHLENVDIEGRMILKCFFKKGDGEHGLD